MPRKRKTQKEAAGPSAAEGTPATTRAQPQPQPGPEAQPARSSVVGPAPRVTAATEEGTSSSASCLLPIEQQQEEYIRTSPTLPPRSSMLSSSTTTQTKSTGPAGPSTLPIPSPPSPPPVSSKGVSFTKRPGFGTLGNRCIVKANHFLTDLPNKDLHHYDVCLILLHK